MQAYLQLALRQLQKDLLKNITRKVIKKIIPTGSKEDGTGVDPLKDVLDSFLGQ